MKIRQVVTELFHVDGQTDMTKLTVVFFFAVLRKRLKMTTCGSKLFYSTRKIY